MQVLASNLAAIQVDLFVFDGMSDIFDGMSDVFDGMSDVVAADDSLTQSLPRSLDRIVFVEEGKPFTIRIQVGNGLCQLKIYKAWL